MSLQRHPSWSLCRLLAGSAPGGNVGDLADTIAQYLECIEGKPSELPPDAPSLAEALAAVTSIRKVIDRAEQRLRAGQTQEVEQS